MQNNSPDPHSNQRQNLSAHRFSHETAEDKSGIDMSFSTLRSVDNVPRLEELSATSVYHILAEIKRSNSVKIPASIKIELEEAGIIESLTDSKYNAGIRDLAMLPDVMEDLRIKTETQRALQKSADELSTLLQSPWHRFWSLSWLGSGKLEQERNELADVTRDLKEACKATESASQHHASLSALETYLSAFTETSEGYVALSKRGNEFFNRFRTESFDSLFTVKTAYKTGIAAVQNPYTNDVEWQSAYKAGVAGVYNPVTEETEWKTAYKTGIAGVWNPVTQEIEWKSAYKSGVAGVWNPVTKEVEWKTAYSTGIAGVFNPITEEVVWHTAYRTGVAITIKPGARDYGSEKFSVTLEKLDSLKNTQ